MGGCVISCLSSCNGCKERPNAHIKKVLEGAPRSVEITSTEKGANESRIRRSPSMADITYEGLVAEYYGSGADKPTLLNVLEEVVTQRVNQNAMGYRTIDRLEKGEIEENGKKKPWEFVHLKPTEYLTYGQMWEKMINFGKGLREIGVDAGSRVGLYEETRYEWMVSLYGLWSQSMTGVTVYANLGEDALEYAIKEAELHVILCNGKSVKNVIKVCKAGGIPAPHFIYTDSLPVDVDLGACKAYSFNDIVAKGASSAVVTAFPKSSDDVALIMYTSGTTGDPKGVVISHGNTVACVKGFSKRLKDFSPEGTDLEGESYVAYLPLAHILEFAAENVFLLRGSLVGYGHPRTLTNTSARPHGDLQEFKPTLLVGVPRIFDTIKKAVEAKLPDGFKRRVFDRAFADRKAALAEGRDTPYWDEKVFAMPRQLLGGRVRAIMSGGAPMSAKTQEFLMVVFGCSAGQGYGLTETCSCATLQSFWDPKVENIGGLLPNCEMKLRDVDEWKHTDPKPRGEICIRGPPVTKGYYKQPEKTAEAFTADGWFATGDVGEVQPDGTMKIVGRVKALAKNAFGEYVALDALESVYVLNDLAMPNGVCVLVDSQKAYICALVLTDEHKAMNFAKKAGIEGSWPEILQKPEFQAKAAASLAETAKHAGKKPFELVKYVRVLNDEWTPENGVLTAAMKLKRRVVDVKYADLIQELFKPE